MSHRKLSGSFKRPGAVYSVWLFVDLRGSSTSLDTIWSNGVPGYAAPVSTDSLRCLPVGDTIHQWPAVLAERECLPREASGSDSPWQLVSACATASCCGPICRDHTSTCRSRAARPTATPASVQSHWSLGYALRWQIEQLFFAQLLTCWSGTSGKDPMLSWQIPALTEEVHCRHVPLLFWSSHWGSFVAGSVWAVPWRWSGLCAVWSLDLGQVSWRNRSL